MINAAQLRVIVGADVAGALSGLGQVNRAIGSTAGFFSRAASTAAGFIGGALGLGALSSIAGGANAAIFGMNSTLEGAQVAFTQLLGSSGAASAFLDQVKQFAKETPFDLPGVLEGSQRLLAYGFSAQEIIPELTRIGDIASGLNLGQEGFSRLLVAVGQTHTAGRVLQQDLNQLQQAGVNTGDIFAIMAQQTGKTVPQLKKAQAAGKLSAATFEKAFNVFADTRFGGLMKAQSATFAGAMSNIRDALGQAGATAFLPLFTALRNLALRFVAFTETAQFQSWITRIQGGVSQLVTWFGTAIPAAWTTLQNAWARVQPVLDQLRAWATTHIPPIWAELAAVISGQLLPAVERLGAIISQDRAPLLAFAAGFRSVFVAMALVNAIASLTTAVLAGTGAVLAFLLSPLTLIAIAVGLLAAAWVTNFGGIRDTLTAFWTGTGLPLLTELWGWLQTAIPAALAALGAAWATVTGALGAAWAAILPPILAVWSFLSGTLFPFLLAIGRLLVAPWILAARVIGGALLPVLGVLGQAFGVVWNALQLVGNAIGLIVRSVLGLAQIVLRVVAPLAAALAGALGTAVAQAIGVSPIVLQTATKGLNQLATDIALKPLGPTPAGGTVDNSVRVDMSGATVNASDPEDVSRLLDQMAARMAEEQAASAGTAVGTTMPEGA